MRLYEAMGTSLVSEPTTGHPVSAGCRTLIVNADDFGFTDGVCEGIVRAIQRGIVTSTSAMVCCEGAPERLARWAPMIRGRIGVHLQLTTGQPLLPAAVVPSITGPDGCFVNRRKQIPLIHAEELYREWNAQVEAIMALGIQPTHIDTHHHVHGRDDIFDVFCRVARNFDLPARPVAPDMSTRLRGQDLACVDMTLTGWYGGELTAESLISVLKEGLERYPEAVAFELMCHPGICDQLLPQLSRYCEERERELRSLTSPGLEEAVGQAGLFILRQHNGRRHSVRQSSGQAKL